MQLLLGVFCFLAKAIESTAKSYKGAFGDGFGSREHESSSGSRDSKNAKV